MRSIEIKTDRMNDVTFILLNNNKNQLNFVSSSSFTIDLFFWNREKEIRERERKKGGGGVVEELKDKGMEREECREKRERF